MGFLIAGCSSAGPDDSSAGGSSAGGEGGTPSNGVVAGVGAQSGAGAAGEPSELGGATGKPSELGGAAGALGQLAAGASGDATLAGAGGRNMAEENPGLSGAAGAGGEAEPLESGPTRVVWAITSGYADSTQHPLAILVDPSGDFSLMGSFHGVIDPGLASDSESESTFLLHFSPGGAWQRADGPAAYGDSAITVAAKGPEGALLLGGNMTTALDFSYPNFFDGNGGWDAFMARREAAPSYVYTFAYHYGDAGDSFVTGLAVDKSGNSVLVGNFDGSVDFGAGPLISAGMTDVMIAGLDAEGEYRWALRAGDVGQEHTRGVARSVIDDSVFVIGEFSSSLTIGSCPSLTSAGGEDAWLAWLSQDGGCLRALQLGDSADQAALAVATSKKETNLVAVAGQFHGTLTLGSASATADPQGDAFVAVYQADADNGTLAPLWLRTIAGGGTQTATAVAFDSHDHVVVVGNDQRADTGPALQDAFAVSYNGLGRVLRSDRLTGAGSRNAVAVGVDDSGYSYLTGTFLGELALSTGTLQNGTGLDKMFVVKLPR